MEPFFQEFSRTFEPVSDRISYELLFVDDGSTDATFERLCQLVADNPQSDIKVIELTRNFGKEAAIWAGLREAEGDFVGIIDADLQQPPQDALNMLEMLIEDPNLDCVAAYQEGRGGKNAHSLFYSVMNKMCGLDMIKDASDFRVFRRVVAETMLSMPEVHRFSKGMFAWMGYNTKAYRYKVRDRYSGKSKWSSLSLWKYAFEGIFAYSTVPLSIATALGILVSVAALAYFVYLVIKTIVLGVDLPGFATITAAILLLGGVQLIVLGIIGKYLGNAYVQGKSRPIAIVRNVVDSSFDAGSWRQ